MGKTHCTLFPSSMVRLTAFVSVALFGLSSCSLSTVHAQPTNGSENSSTELFGVGFGRSDVTPRAPVRLSGYAVRTKSHEGVADPLNARAMVVTGFQSRESVILVSVDSIAITKQMTVEISEWVLKNYGTQRHQLVLCSTHSHAAPHLSGGLENLYREQSSPAQQSATDAYTAYLTAGIKNAIREAWLNRRSATLEFGTSTTNVAVNRRVLQDGTWTGFGIQADGATDNRVRVVCAKSKEGSLLGGMYLYACHCTTLGGDFNRISGDWAGLSASRLEAMHSESVFLPIIGCGADANPEPRGTYEDAQMHAASLVDAVQSVVKQDSLDLISEFPQTNFGYAGLAAEQPTTSRIEEMASSTRSNERRWAAVMKQTKREMGRLPESYPMPIHVWQFGKQLSWVFLGGEVVVDYQFSIEKELETAETWVAAYSDDVFAYVADEKMRSQGGYEVDFSMIYYLQPGRWQTGTQALILRRVKEIADGILIEAGPLSPDKALRATRVPDDMEIALAAAEPKVQDPINLAFGTDGKVWVVEMADYPLGSEGGGRIRWLKDENGDGQLEQSQVFLDGLSYPTSVYPWHDGVLVIAAPEIFFAADRDGDGRADFRETLLSGIAPANPQHRASGFQIGLDGWLHLGVGHGTTELHSTRNAQTYQVAHKDIAWNPNSGEIRLVSGETQFVRSRDAFGNWFGNSNSRPMYHYVIEDRYLEGKSLRSGIRHDLLKPAVAPPVLPRSATIDRFNDLYARDRFTSACSAIVGDTPFQWATDRSAVFICEPVHNLVARFEMQPDGASWAASRNSDDSEYDFFTSTDPWSRPVRAVAGPDGALWIVDMVRRVIEHPEWIPTAWQANLSLRSGANQGRLYRITARNESRDPGLGLPVLNSTDSILKALGSDLAARRDLALLAGLQSDWAGLEQGVRALLNAQVTPPVQASAIGLLRAKGWLRTDDLLVALSSTDARLVGLGLRYAEQLADLTPPLQQALSELPGRNLGPQLDLQWLLSSRMLQLPSRDEGVSMIARRSGPYPWLLNAFSLEQDSSTAACIIGALASSDENSEPDSADSSLRACIDALWPELDAVQRSSLVEQIIQAAQTGLSDLTAAELALLSKVLQSDQVDSQHRERLQQVAIRSSVSLLDESKPVEERLALVPLLASDLLSGEECLATAQELLEQENSIELKQAVLGALQTQGDEVSVLIFDTWREMGQPARGIASGILMSRRGWVAELVTQLEMGHVTPRQLDAATIQQLRSYRDRDLRTRCLTVLGKPTERSKVVEEYLQQIPKPESDSNAKELYTQHCAVCHESQNNQRALGPPLQNLKHWTVPQWVTAIMDPNQNVEPKYLQSIVATDDGQVLSGLLISEDDNQLILGQQNGQTQTVTKNRIAQMQQSAISLMPEGFEDKLTPAQLAAVIGYLKSR